MMEKLVFEVSMGQGGNLLYDYRYDIGHYGQ